MESRPKCPLYNINSSYYTPVRGTQPGAHQARGVGGLREQRASKILHRRAAATVLHRRAAIKCHHATYRVTSPRGGLLYRRSAASTKCHRATYRVTPPRGGLYKMQRCDLQGKYEAPTRTGLTQTGPGSASYLPGSTTAAGLEARKKCFIFPFHYYRHGGPWKVE